MAGHRVLRNSCIELDIKGIEEYVMERGGRDGERELERGGEMERERERERGGERWKERELERGGEMERES